MGEAEEAAIAVDIFLHGVISDSSLLGTTTWSSLGDD